MVRVCYCPTEPGYSEVGGKGLGLYKPWRESFDNFVRDVGLSNNRRLQRKNNAIGFEPGNVYWGLTR